MQGARRSDVRRDSRRVELGVVLREYMCACGASLEIEKSIRDMKNLGWGRGRTGGGVRQGRVR